MCCIEEEGKERQRGKKKREGEGLRERNQGWNEGWGVHDATGWIRDVVMAEI